MAEDNALEIVVVNLERSADRRAKMIETLAPFGLPYSIFNAVEGRNGHPLFEKFNPRLAEIRRGFILNAGELGCYASHYLLWERSVRDNKALLIFEDDVSINGNFLDAYHYAADKIGTYGLIRFSGHKQRSFRVCETSGSGTAIIRFRIGPHGTSCYAVSPKAAAKLLAKADVWFEPVDCHLDRFWTHGVGSYAVSPLPVTHMAETAEQSEIWQGAKRERKSRRFRQLRAIYRAGDDISRFVWNLPNIGRWQGLT